MIHQILAATQLERTVQGVPIILLMVVGAIVALFWVFLPVVLWGKLNRIIHLLESINRNSWEPGKKRPSQDSLRDMLR